MLGVAKYIVRVEQVCWGWVLSVVRICRRPMRYACEVNGCGMKAYQGLVKSRQVTGG